MSKVNNTDQSLTLTAQTPTFDLIKGRVSHVFKKDLPYLVTLAIFLAVWVGLAKIATTLVPDTETALTQNGKQYLDIALRNSEFYFAFFAFFLMFKLWRSMKEASLLGALKNNYHQDSRPYLGVPVLLVISIVSFAVFLYAYSTIKTRIPNFMPFNWDHAFYQADKLIFLGKDPWQYFAFLYEFPRLISALDFIYDFWAVILICMWIAMMGYSQKLRQKRYQFIFALLLTWFIGGNIFAILLSSAGPCYYGGVTGQISPYLEQMAILNTLDAEISLRAVEYQQTLWTVYENPTIGLGGISAMPSMHCASSILLVCFFWPHKTLRVLAMAFCAMIFISSFLLAWHYAVDGLLALPIAVLCWKVSGRLSARLAK